MIYGYYSNKNKPLNRTILSIYGFDGIRNWLVVIGTRSGSELNHRAAGVGNKGSATEWNHHPMCSNYRQKEYLKFGSKLNDNMLHTCAMK